MRDGVRYYPTPYGDFKSVTTILSEKLKKEGVEEWKEAVGEDKAARVLHQAGVRGSSIHLMAERYLQNVERYGEGQGSININDFNKIARILNVSVGDIYFIESQVYSKRLKTAGTCDLCCQFLGNNSIVDFKTARRERILPEQLESFWLQTTAYAIMVEELYGIDIPQVVVILINYHEEKPKLYVEKKEQFIPRVLEVFDAI